MPTIKESRDFLSDVFGDVLLAEVLQWVANHLDPSDVFSNEQLEAWADHFYNRGQGHEDVGDSGRNR
jgi:hypothetical protein